MDRIDLVVIYVYLNGYIIQKKEILLSDIEPGVPIDIFIETEPSE